MLTKIIAIACLTVRGAARSRVIALLMSLTVLGVVVFPFMIKSDGTAAGLARLFINYAFGLAVTILSVAAAWNAAGAVALDVAERRMDILMTKPVRVIEIWLGKWLGLTAINAAMLVLAGLLIYGGLWLTTWRELPSPAQRAQLWNDVLAAHSYLSAVHTTTTNTTAVVLPGGEYTWHFTAHTAARHSSGLALQFRFATSRVERQMPVHGSWQIALGDNTTPLVYQADYTPNMDHTLKIETASPSGRITATYRNTETNEPAAVVFEHANGARLLQRECGFLNNFARALLLALARLAFFTALGVTIGSAVSFPVAVFTAFAFLLIAALSGWINAETFLIMESAPARGWMEGLGQVSARCVAHLTHWSMPPLTRFDPLDFLSVGLVIPWQLVLRAWVMLVLIYGGATGLLGAWLLNRREIGSATQ